MKKNIYFLLILIASWSCSDNSPVNDKVANDLDEFKSYSLDIYQPKVRFSDLIASVEVMRLEETENSLLSSVLVTQKTNDYLIITSADQGGMFENRGDIFIFDLNGNIVNKMNRKGYGPEEYVGIDDIWVERDTMSIYSRLDIKVNKYSIDGGFIDSKKMPYQVGHVLGYKNGYAMDMNRVLINDSSRYRYAILSENLNVVETYLSFKTSSDHTLLSSPPTVSYYKTGVLFFRQVSDTIYFLNGKNFSPIVHLDFGEEWFWNDKGETSSQYFRELREFEGVWNITMHMGERYIYVMGYEGFASQTGSPFFLIDRLTSEVHNIDFRNQADAKFKVKAQLWDKERMIFSVRSTEISSFLTELSQDQIFFAEGTTLEAIESSENPVLMWVKFKGLK